ncbi:uncharacterized protein LOC126249774 [Schistocerca nitens]|uniref:uncharacterized protein LOC126249774 n=1 Tax=Schistocerca nitens TaxID=7011 RepID=UPI00211771D1|nr:uncharacterized protein LOC126249774 [Schistocerca nitens]
MTSYRHWFIVFQCITSLFVRGTSSAQCWLNGDELSLENTNGTSASLRRKEGLLTCPGPGDPSHYTECCWDSRYQCCPVQAAASMDDQLVKVVGVAVISSCLLLTVGTIVCCFWSRCPLYNACRINYTHGTSIAYAKDDDVANGIMPPEEKSNQHHYTPNAVNIKQFENV